MARPKKKTLLVPVDGSDSALRALRYAAGRFRGGGFDQLVALNVQVPMQSSRFVTQQMIDEHHERLAEETLEPARRLATRLEVPLTCATANAAPAEAIVNFVRKGDEIVMGTRGLGRVGGLLLGSVASRVVQLADVPVTLVK